jgi:hypothetical protein
MVIIKGKTTKADEDAAKQELLCTVCGNAN